MNAGGSTVAGQRPRLAVHDPRAPGLSLRDAFFIFTRQRSARIIAGMLGGVLVLRLAVGQSSGWDPMVLVALLCLHPFTEWVVHVGILHWRPRRLGRWTVDTDLSREHRLHHQMPHEPRHWYIPMKGALVGFAITLVVTGLIAPNLAIWLSFVLGLCIIGLLYEWTHYLCHTSYRPKGRFYRRLWRHHRLHHFKNEHYWMGVTMHLGDRVLGTMVSPKDVPTSPTCRDLLGQDV